MLAILAGADVRGDMLRKGRALLPFGDLRSLPAGSGEGIEARPEDADAGSAGVRAHGFHRSWNWGYRAAARSSVCSAAISRW